ncbi:MAG TPA: xanthine dehydrogenase family protein molybdopterin-binding subunit [Candidatus Binataceae bacterium]|nr:xanthine dehydrogenase family protein molybdopterin-binding subunit [Candidatus Binataceae bacterium]HVB80052.1 xanthine dehydrogenase family protein molybdopterin-binding subunit [Candidatus Binataceae bacterium]
MAAAVVPKFVGTRVKRREDPRLISGNGTYCDDVRLVGMLSVVILRSPYGHAKINSINVDAARKLPGVVAVITGEDIKGKLGSLTTAAPAEHIPYHPPLAQGRVRFVGEAVVAVVATDSYIAQDAIDLVEVDYDPLPVINDPEKAIEQGAPLIHEEFGTNISTRAQVSSGEIDGAMRAADRVIKFRLVNQRLAPVPMEGRATVAQWNQGSGHLTLWSSTQGPHLLRSYLCDVLKLPENRMRVIAPEVGGGFGAKLNVYAEEVLTAYLAMTLKRPVKWIERRRENLATTTHGRDMIVYVEAPVKNDGTLLGLKARFICDAGAYLQLLTPMIPGFAGMMMTGCYKVPAMSFEQLIVFTNKMAPDAYRGAGRPEACYIAERTMDMIALELNLDPVEVRRKNFIPKEDFPAQIASGLVYDSGDYGPALDKALKLIDYPKVRAEQAEARKHGRLLGIGICSYVEICGIGPSAMLPPTMKGGGWESATIRMEPDCKVTVLTGVSPHGQGQETSFAQLVADELGIGIDDVNVVHGDTAIVQYGTGTFGSRGTSVGGAALMMATQKLQAKMKKIASTMMEVPPDQIVFHQGTMALASDLTKSIPMQRVVDGAYGYKVTIPGVEPGLNEVASYEPTACTFPFGTHACVVEVDPDTGVVKFLRYVAVDDCGRVINPLLVEGQVHGGIAQGIAQALYEEVIYDENGQLLTATLMDYAVPKAEMLPHYELDSTVTPSPINPLGVKGVGEAGTIGSTPCVVNAVHDALKHLGIKNLDMPLKPERLWRAIKSARKA